MSAYRSLSHTRWDCKYHVVLIPKRRKKVIDGQVRVLLGAIFHELAGHKEVEIMEGHLQPDHVHMCVRIPPKLAVSNVVGYLKGKSAIMMARQFSGKERILPAKVSGRGVTLYRRLDWMRRPSSPISRTRRMRKNAMIR